MKLYGFGFGNTIVSVDVIKETPKGYKVDHDTLHPYEENLHIPKFIKKYECRWFPTRSGVIQYMREILKKRILYADENIVRAKMSVKEMIQKQVDAEKNLQKYDTDNGIVAGDDECEESYWMAKHKSALGEGD